MSNKPDKDQRRKKKLHEREKAKKRRTAIIRDGEKRIVIQHGSTKGYDIGMVRDFLDHLLLESAGPALREPEAAQGSRCGG